jgi:hypothetical protein
MKSLNVKALSDKELIAEVQRLAELDRRYREDNRIEFFDKKPNPGPNPIQEELLEAWLDPQYKVFVMTGGNRLGKTTLDILVSLSVMFGKFLWNGQKLHFIHNQPRKVRYIGQDWEKHIRAVVLPELEKWWPKNRPVKKKKNNQGVDSLWIDEKTGSSLEIMSNLQDSDLHEGWSGDLTVYDEPPKRAIRVANARGLIDRQGRELFCMTLLKEAWVDREVIKARNPDGTPDMSVFSVKGTSYNNVGYGITEVGIKQFIKTLTDDEISARIDGNPSYMSGLVYPTFNRKKHLRKRFEIPLDWIVDIAIDVHPRENQAILFIATSPRNERYVFHEIWDHGDGTWVGEQIIRVIKKNTLRIGHIIVDPLSKGDKNNPNTTFDKIDAVLYKHGYVLDTATKDKQSGIIEVKNHLVGPNKEPSLFFFDDLVRTIYEIEGYMYDEESQKPMDKDDHMMENLYRICMLDTRWYDAGLEDEEDDKPKKTVNKWTGY